MLFNMANARRARAEWALASGEYRLVAEALPGFPEAIGNRGLCSLRMGDRDAAERDFREAYGADSLSPARSNLEAMGLSL
jgi:Tfp pilus assembly protein PilF